MKRRPDESAAWRALRESLAEDEGGHPAAELLLAYTDQRSSLGQDVVEEIDAHLAACASCRDEIGVLGALTISPVRETSDARQRTQRPVWQRIVSAVSGPVWRPALAFAALVVLMVPTLRMIRQDRTLLLDRIEHHDDVATTVNEVRPLEWSRPLGVGASTGTAVRESEEQVRNDGDERRVVTVAPTIPVPSGESAATLPSTPALSPAARAETARRTEPPAPAAMDRMAERQTRPARENDSSLGQAFRAPTSAKRHFNEVRSVAPTLDYVPGGRASIPARNVEHVALQLMVIRAGGVAMDMRSRGAVVGGTGPIIIDSTVAEVDIVVIAADGRRNARRVEIGAGREGATELSVAIPADWFAAGANHVDVIDLDGRKLAEESFVIER